MDQAFRRNRQNDRRFYQYGEWNKFWCWQYGYSATEIFQIWKQPIQKTLSFFRREWVIAFADLWWQLEQHLECWCVQREPEQSTFQLEHEHRLPLRSTLRCQNRKLQGLPTVRGDKGTCFHSGWKAGEKWCYVDGVLQMWHRLWRLPVPMRKPPNTTK